MTNQQKLQAIYNLTGGDLFSQILQAVGPGTIHFPKDANAARRETRNTAIRAAYYSDKYAGMKAQEICRILGQQYRLSPDRIRKIVNTVSGSR